MVALQINDEISVGPQPSEEELFNLSQRGFQSVVNLRADGEENQPLSPAEEGEQAGKVSLSYTHLPVPSKEPMQDEQVDRFRELVNEMPKPMFVHCAKGKRAGAFALMHQALENHWSGDEALEQARSMGFEIDNPEMEDFIRSYIDRHRSGMPNKPR